MRRIITKLFDFIDKDIWRIHTKKLPRQRSFLIKQLRIIVLAVREFRSNKCQLNASALTFYSLLSVVPVAAMAFGIAKGFGFDRLLEKQVLEKFPGQEVTITQIITFANNLLDNTQGGLVAGVGVMVLFWTVIQVLNSIETSFNDIWGIKTGRSLGRKITDYLSIMLVCPFFVIASSGVTVFAATQVEMILQKLSFLGPLSPAIFFLLALLPYVMIWILFAFIYIFMPNTKVKLSAGIIGGIVAGTIYQVVQVTYIQFQVAAAKANAIYGSFAALPLFLVWLQVSWRVVLFGTEVTFAHQNVDTYEFEQDCLSVSHAFKRLVSLQITSILVKRFVKGEKPLTATQISDEVDIPIRLVRDILFELTEAGIISEMQNSAYRLPLYQPAQDVNHLTIQFVTDVLEKKGTGSVPVTHNEELTKLEQSLKHFEDLLKKSPANHLLKDI
ncbi:MAG: YihY/virulence factor BrkB family protein [Candidatus Omnitrophica bacterium]|nr:YihY/virulence factor BrkB family protein [Candidatus Omnitrophota bacterium]